MLSSLYTFLLYSFLATQLTTAKKYILHHRILSSSPSTVTTPLTPYGFVTISNSSSSGLETNEAASFSKIKSEKRGLNLDDAKSAGELETGWYQVGLEDSESEDGEESWVLAYTRACYLPNTPLQLTISISSNPSNPPSIHLEPHPSASDAIPRDGLCPSSESGVGIDKSSFEGPSLDVIVKRPVRAFNPTPLSATPVTIQPDGHPAPPPVEKTFLQKYWLPMIGVAFFLLGQLGQEDKRGAGGGGGGQGGGGQGR